MSPLKLFNIEVKVEDTHEKVCSAAEDQTSQLEKEKSIRYSLKEIIEM